MDLLNAVARFSWSFDYLLLDRRHIISRFEEERRGDSGNACPTALDGITRFSARVDYRYRQRGGALTVMAIPGEKAIQMVRNAHAQAAQLDIAVTAVVVDPSGRMIALGRMDKARPITVEMALNKAYTAASFQQPTKELAGMAGQTWFQSLVVSSNGRIMPGGGALPVVEGGNVVGAIAVAGGTDDQDQKCAEEALAGYNS